jgi:hypothetical protein
MEDNYVRESKNLSGTAKNSNMKPTASSSTENQQIQQRSQLHQFYHQKQHHQQQQHHHHHQQKHHFHLDLPNLNDADENVANESSDQSAVLQQLNIKSNENVNSSASTNTSSNLLKFKTSLKARLSKDKSAANESTNQKQAETSSTGLSVPHDSTIISINETGYASKSDSSYSKSLISATKNEVSNAANKKSQPNEAHKSVAVTTTKSSNSSTSAMAATATSVVANIASNSSSSSLLSPLNKNYLTSTSGYHPARRESFLYKPDNEFDNICKVPIRSSSIASEQ